VDCEKRAGAAGSRRGFCAQCQRDALGKNGAGLARAGGARSRTSALGIATPFRGVTSCQKRGLATVQDGKCYLMGIRVEKVLNYFGNLDDQGPMREYNSRVKSGRLTDDEHQRGRGIPRASEGYI